MTVTMHLAIYIYIQISIEYAVHCDVVFQMSDIASVAGTVMLHYMNDVV